MAAEAAGGVGGGERPRHRRDAATPRVPPADVVALLACPLCGGRMQVAGRAVRCGAGHSFDIARQGYVNLLPGEATAATADRAEMVAARVQVLEAGWYAPLVAAIVAAAVDAAPPAGAVVDVGAGTGHHLAAVLDGLGERPGLAIDLSKHAARRAARAHPRAGAVVADAWARLPVRDRVAALVLSIFAPRNAGELARVLAADGRLVVVTPLPEHLAVLVDALDLVTVDERKEERLARQLGGAFVREAVVQHRHDIAVDAAAATAIVGMGPSAHHVDAADLADRIATLPLPVDTQVAVRIARYRRR